MNNATKFLLFAFSLGITCLLIVYSKRVADTGLDTSNTAVGKLSEFNRELSESDITMYDGLEIKGSDVVNFIKKNLGGYAAAETAAMYVYIKTGLSEATYVNGVSLPNLQDFTSLRYVKPRVIFTGDIVRDANDVIIGVTFVQK